MIGLSYVRRRYEQDLDLTFLGGNEVGVHNVARRL
jgi:hypothetical protein